MGNKSNDTLNPFVLGVLMVLGLGGGGAGGGGGDGRGESCGNCACGQLYNNY